MSLGKIISEARKKAELSQKELANRLKKEDGTPISAQYLNDIEHDRRNLPSEHLLKQLAKELALPVEYLNFLAGNLPGDLRSTAHSPEDVTKAFRAFRKALKK